MAASVRVEDEAFSDVRYRVLANVCLLADADHARGKMLVLWRQCTAQARYVLPASYVVAVLGANGVLGLVESALGEEVVDGIRICGTEGRIEWLAKLRANAKKGGEAKAAKRQSGGSQEAAKTLPTPCPPTPTPTPTPMNPDLPERSPPAAATPKAARDKAEVEGLRPTIAAFDAAYRAKTGVAPTWGAKQTAMLKPLVKAHGAAEVQRRIEILFTAPPRWLRGPHDLGTLVSQFDKLAAPDRGPTQVAFDELAEIQRDPEAYHRKTCEENPLLADFLNQGRTTP